MSTNRDSVPAWATQDVPLATQNQISYIARLKGERELTEEQQRWINQQIANDGTLSRPRASEIISKLLKLPHKQTEQDIAERSGRLEDLEWQKPLVDLPPGRYALDSSSGELRFYHRWQGKQSHNLGRFALYVVHGPDESKLPRPAQVAIAAKIIEAGVRECAIRYGLEIGECSNCGRRLTNRISRELGIGPVCGGRMFGSDFNQMVSYTRNNIIARGLDPDEELE